MIGHFLKYRTCANSTDQFQCQKDITCELMCTSQQLTDKRYDEKAITCIIKSLEEQLEGLTEDF